MIDLRQIVPRLGAAVYFDAVLEEIAGETAHSQRRGCDSSIAASPPVQTLGWSSRLGSGAKSYLVMSEALSQHAPYFDAGATASVLRRSTCRCVRRTDSLMMIGAWSVTIVSRLVASRNALCDTSGIQPSLSLP